MPKRSEAATRDLAHHRNVLLGFQRKAEEYLDALYMELGIPMDPEKTKPLQIALRQDFIEVHNAAIGDPVLIPESKEELARLLD